MCVPPKKPLCFVKSSNAQYYYSALLALLHNTLSVVLASTTLHNALSCYHNFTQNDVVLLQLYTIRYRASTT